MKIKTSLILLAVFSITACKEKSRENTPDFDRSEMLNNIANNIAVPAYDEALNSVNALNMNFKEFKNNANGENLSVLKSQFLISYKNWQRISLFDFGPADDESLKSNLNLYPADVAKIESNISNGSFDLDQLQNKNAKGFPAVDFLLFAHEDSVTLSELTVGNLASNRMAYLEVLIERIQSRIKVVSDKWRGEENYSTTFESRNGTDAGSGLGLLVNSLNKHLESDFRDGKLGIPLGIRSAGVPIPDDVEAYFSNYSTLLFKENFYAIENLYLGRHGDTDGAGLEEHLIGVEAEDLDQKIKAQFESVRSELIRFQNPLDYEIETNSDGLYKLYEEIQKLVVLMKVDLPSRLSVLISYQDNDGD